MNAQVGPAETPSPVQNQDLTTVSNALVHFDKVSAGLQIMRERYAGVIFPVETTEGMEDARKARAEIREPRYEVERIRKAAKKPLLNLGKKLDAQAEQLTDALLAIEEPIDSQIKAEEDRKEKEKQAKIAAELARVEAIQELMADITELPLKMANSLQTAATIQSAITGLEGTEITESEFMEFTDKARAAKTKALETLQTLLLARKEIEAEQERLARERAEMERQQEEQCRRDAEAAAKRREEEAAAEELRKAAAREEEARLQGERERIARENEKIAQERAELEERERQAQDIRDAEAKRQAAAREKEAHLEALRAEHRRLILSEIEGIKQQVIIAETGREPYIKGHTLAGLDTLIHETERWPVEAAHFGDQFDYAVMVKQTVLTRLRQIRETIVQELEAAKLKELAELPPPPPAVEESATPAIAPESEQTVVQGDSPMPWFPGLQIEIHDAFVRLCAALGDPPFSVNESIAQGQFLEVHLINLAIEKIHRLNGLDK